MSAASNGRRKNPISRKLASKLAQDNAALRAEVAALREELSRAVAANGAYELGREELTRELATARALLARWLVWTDATGEDPVEDIDALSEEVRAFLDPRVKGGAP